jgi:hypothetical protein
MPRRRIAEAFGDGRKANPHQRISMMTTATTITIPRTTLNAAKLLCGPTR